MTEKDTPSNPDGGSKDPKDSGLDMAATIEWYTQNQDYLYDHLDIPEEFGIEYPVEGPEHFGIDLYAVSGIFSIFPGAALERSRLSTIQGRPTAYFHRDSTSSNPIKTANADEALTPTAIIPSETSNEKWVATGVPASDIILYAIPDTVSPKVKAIIHTEGLVHEIAHSIITHEHFGAGKVLKLPDGTITNSRRFLDKIAAEAEKHPPVSHYSSFFRNADGGFDSWLGREEELCELIAADFLRFAYADDPAARLNPMSSRPEVSKMLQDYLLTELAKYNFIFRAKGLSR